MLQLHTRTRYNALAVFSVALPLLLFGVFAITHPSLADSSASTTVNTAIGEARLTDPLGGVGVRDLIARIIRVLLGLSGAFALLMFIWGGLLWMASQGEPDKIKTGQKTLQWAAIGLALIFGAYTILNFYVTSLTQATQ